MATALESIPGYADLTNWFGIWPTFHDAEVLQICLDREGPSRVKILTWRTTGEIDDRGYYIRTRQAIVIFTLDDLRDVSLDSFSQQNVISGLDIEATQNGLRLTMHPCFGVSGRIDAQHLRLTLEPL